MPNAKFTTATRVAAGIVGTASVAAAAWQIFAGVPVQELHPPLQTDVLFAPIGLLVGAVLLIIACSPRRWWF